MRTATSVAKRRPWTPLPAGCSSGRSPKTSNSDPMIYAATIFLSSFLLFLVQPLIARLILPWFGGSAAVWTTCMLFFQIVLLAGYAYAHVLGKLAGRRQAVVHTVLLIAALATLPIMP